MNTRIYKVVALLTTEKKTFKTIEIEVKETPKTYKIVNTNTKDIVRYRNEINKDSMNTIVSKLRNTVSSQSGVLEFHMFCLESDIEKSEKLVKDQLTEHFTAIKKNVDEMYLKLICI